MVQPIINRTMIRELLNKIFRSQPTTYEDVISFRQAFELTEMPIVTFYNNGEKFHFLLDSGSNNCIIDSNVLEKMIYKETDKTVKVVGLEGNVKEVQCCILPLTCKEKEYEYWYMVVDMEKAFSVVKKDTGVTLSGLIGTNFFNHYKYVLDFDELKAYSKKQ